MILFSIFAYWNLCFKAIYTASSDFSPTYLYINKLTFNPMSWTEINEYLSKFNIFASPEGSDKKLPQSSGEAHRFGMKALKADGSRSFIAAGLIINGSLSSDADVMVDGVVFGDVFSKGNITIHGNVEGAVYGRNVDLVGANVKGDVRATEHLLVQSSEVHGNIFSIKAELDSKIDGNIQIQESLIIRSTADIKGDIVAASISIEENAIIDGKLSIKQALKPDESDENTPEASEDKHISQGAVA